MAGTDFVKYRDEEGTPYYYNLVTEQTQWDTPVYQFYFLFTVFGCDFVAFKRVDLVDCSTAGFVEGGFLTVVLLT